ncbi:MAG TPA: 3-hydroxybutyryl-CoA dehydrogenase [Gemmatimonadales bacterium]|nr:3-hydroxybutyryl-CoA dehydrogenase [Gemmatimonadales bacterium]
MTEGIGTVGVIGCGLMGSGIAQTAAVAGYRTLVREVAEVPLAKGRAAIERSLAKLVEKGTVTAAERDAALGRLTFTTELADLDRCDIVIEAVTEDLAVKNALWGELDARCPDRTIFASNTSSLPIGSMAAATGRADRFIGLHFFNPVPLMPLVEVVRGLGTSGETFDRAMAFARSLGKQPVVSGDTPGFLVNRLLVPYLLDAVRALETGTGSVADLDTAMRLGCGHPMGPFTLLDFVGLDTTLRIAEIMFDEFRESRFAPPPLLRRMVTAGLYGRKSGRGFYDYSTQPPRPTPVGSKR